MNDHELFAAWQDHDKEEQKLYQTLRGEFSDIARQKSNDIFRVIQRNIYLESIMGVLASGAILWKFWEYTLFFSLLALLIIGAVIIGGRVYLKYLVELRKVHSRSIKKELGAKRKILSRYIKQQLFYTYVFLPSGYFLGAAYALKGEDLDTQSILILVSVLIVSLILLIWLAKKYIHFTYGRHLISIDTIIEGFEENEIDSSKL